MVVYSRNDIPDNYRPERMSIEELLNYMDSIYAVAGNCVLIDHGQNEFSFLAHLKQGFVTCQIGDQVKQGDILGHVGNSGNSSGPHLHYHLMDGPNLFKSQGLPVIFENSSTSIKTPGFYRLW